MTGMIPDDPNRNATKTTMKTRIKELRAKHNLTQEELAEKVKVRRETIVFLEKGRYNPSLRLAHDIAEFFNCAIEEVFMFDEPHHEPAKDHIRHYIP